MFWIEKGRIGYFADLKRQLSERRNAFQFIAAGIIYGFVIFVISALMGGAGHGWTSGIYSAAGIVIIPFLGAAYANRGKSSSLVFTLVAFAGMLLIDYYILNASIAEGRGYFKKSLPLSAGWLLLWGSWQLGVVWLLFSELGSTVKKTS